MRRGASSINTKTKASRGGSPLLHLLGASLGAPPKPAIGGGAQHAVNATPDTEDEMTDMLVGAAATALETLAYRLDGELVLPADAGWDEARTAWNLAADQNPYAIVLAESARDVAETIRAARDE